MIGIIILLAAGAFLAFLLDEFVLKRGGGRTLKVEGPPLMQALKENKQYETIRQGQKVSRDRSVDRRPDHRGHLERSGDGGDGGDVLRFLPRRKM